MNWTNYHMHTLYCDGKCTAEEHARQAVENQMLAIGFSSHAPVSFETDWHVKQADLGAYLQDIKHVKAAYPQVQIYTGLEVDFIPDVIGPGDFEAYKLDVIVGSVHYIGQYADGEHFCMDFTAEELARGLREVYADDVQAMVRAYYERVQMMVTHDPPDIIGHLDLIKKLNKGNRFFDETEAWYKEIVEETIDVISNSSCIVEVNTRGFYQGKTTEFYPSKWILEMCFEKNIAVTISSDAHHFNELENNFGEATKLLLIIGYQKVTIYMNNEWVAVPLLIDGLQVPV